MRPGPNSIDVLGLSGSDSGCGGAVPDRADDLLGREPGSGEGLCALDHSVACDHHTLDSTRDIRFCKEICFFSLILN